MTKECEILIENAKRLSEITDNPSFGLSGDNMRVEVELVGPEHKKVAGSIIEAACDENEAGLSLAGTRLMRVGRSLVLGPQDANRTRRPTRWRMLVRRVEDVDRSTADRVIKAAVMLAADVVRRKSTGRNDHDF